jgi:3D-(3,5/4)-trihydroxycyclohexane-1,2-dione acylhydrolase (decyclizing)
VNDCFKPVSRYWDRISRPEQLVTALPEAMRVLTSPSETGAVTLSLPEDTQTEAFDYPSALFEQRVWIVARPRGDADAMRRAAEVIRNARCPLIIAGGGVLFSDAAAQLASFAAMVRIGVGETQAGKSSMPWDHPYALGPIGATGGSAANQLAREADVVIAIGTRLSDFTTMSKTAFQDPGVRFVGINVCEFDAFKHSAVPVVADARVALEELSGMLRGHTTDAAYNERLSERNTAWHAEVDRLRTQNTAAPFAQADVIAAVNDAASPSGVVVGAAGSLPGDLHKLWRSSEPNTYHLEYGYSCMGYEIAGGLGVKMADPSREVYVMLGDGSFLMMAQEIVTSVQEGYKLTIVLCDSSGYASIGGLSRSLGSGGFGTSYPDLPVDLAANAASLGAIVHKPTTSRCLAQDLAHARAADRTTVIYLPVDPLKGVPGYDSWWDVPVAEISDQSTVQAARSAWQKGKNRQRYFL